MRVSEIELVADDNSCLLQARVSSGAFSAPFTLWYRFPASATPFVSVDSANPWVAALLLPAMWVGEPLELSVPISPKLFRALPQIQTIYLTWLPTLSKVEVNAPLRKDPPSIGTEVGLFFSSGIDSWYSLLKNHSEGLLNDSISQLIVIHGADIDVGEWKKDVYARLLANTHMIAERFRKKVLGVASNVKALYTKLGISWHWTQGGALASVGLAAENGFRKFYIAAGITYAKSMTRPDLFSGGSHPLFDPLWSTESSMFAHDGCEATRFEKIRIVAESQLAMDTLRVCWASDRPEYNCGECSKCLRVMLALHIAGVLGKCRTLPSAINTGLLRRIPFLFASETAYLQEYLSQLGGSATDNDIRVAATEGIARGMVYFEHVNDARRTIEKLIPLKDPLIMVDEERIRLDLGRPRVIPFLERDGFCYGRPPDDETAVHELERLRAAGAKFVAFWREAFWWLDYYVGLNRHLRSTYPCILESDSLVVFDLRDAIAQSPSTVTTDSRRPHGSESQAAPGPSSHLAGAS